MTCRVIKINKQQELLYKIVCLRTDRFYLEMKDIWGFNDMLFNREMLIKIKNYETEYKAKYGSLPIWDSIDDVMKTKKELERMIV